MLSRRPRPPSLRERRLLGALLLALCPLALAPAAAGQAPRAAAGTAGGRPTAAPEPPSAALDEYAVKAAFLYNFAKFVEWPQSAFPELQAPVALCVLGADPFGRDLDRAVRGRTAQGRPVLVRRLAGSEAVEACHVLFVASSERERFAEVLGAVAGQSVLTVGEDDEFARAGGMISFVVRDRRVRFAIDVDAAERAGLKLSSRLLDLAELKVGGAKGRRRR